MAVTEHKILGRVECVRSLRARSIRLVVRPDGTLRLSYPIFTSLKHALAFAESKAEWVDATRQRLRERTANYPTIAAKDVELLRREARQYIPATVERLASQHGFRYSSLRISSAHTRWGSCSGRNGISISLFVMLLPEHLREFIIIHELCHTRHHNHSAAFHSLVDSLVAGNEKAFNRELKAFKIPRIVE